MMEQRVNLYQERLRPRRLYLSFRQLSLVLLLCVIAMAGWSVRMEVEQRGLLAQNQSLKARQKTIADELNSANAELARLLADNRIDREIAGVSREITARRRVLSFVDANQFGSGKGFSGYLASLSRLKVDNLWLDEIFLSEGHIRIHGSTLDAELVPPYFDRFSEEAVFQGNRFDIFQLERGQPDDWKVDFQIATSEKLDD